MTIPPLARWLRTVQMRVQIGFFEKQPFKIAPTSSVSDMLQVLSVAGLILPAAITVIRFTQLSFPGVPLQNSKRRGVLPRRTDRYRFT